MQARWLDVFDQSVCHPTYLTIELIVRNHEEIYYYRRNCKGTQKIFRQWPLVDLTMAVGKDTIDVYSN